MFKISYFELIGHYEAFFIYELIFGIGFARWRVTFFQQLKKVTKKSRPVLACVGDTQIYRAYSTHTLLSRFDYELHPCNSPLGHAKHV